MVNLWQNILYPEACGAENYKYLRMVFSTPDSLLFEQFLTGRWAVAGSSKQ